MQGRHAHRSLLLACPKVPGRPDIHTANQNLSAACCASPTVSNGRPWLHPCMYRDSQRYICLPGTPETALSRSQTKIRPAISHHYGPTASTPPVSATFVSALATTNRHLCESHPKKHTESIDWPREVPSTQRLDYGYYSPGFLGTPSFAIKVTSIQVTASHVMSERPAANLYKGCLRTCPSVLSSASTASSQFLIYPASFCHKRLSDFINSLLAPNSASYKLSTASKCAKSGSSPSRTAITAVSVMQNVLSRELRQLSPVPLAPHAFYITKKKAAAAAEDAGHGDAIFELCMSSHDNNGKTLPC
ncbi:hypothetical protein B0T24DRAFT_31680 [Lasiosphaeria ovina]|uniref:Uncharacterized protein n=1 Tax=Lasiosphaeria ovina TaxID=92902 RepID=A0AAE0TXD1_9PEZI|nr:hypothetical protein B0T24DRAFT_31680 [Lasiosphaeria ovina]